MACRALISRHLARYFSFTTCLLLVLLKMQQAQCTPLEGSGTDAVIPSTDAPFPDEVVTTCTKDCSGVPTSQLCASNGKTYESVCHFENAKCDDSDLFVFYNEACMTLPPPPENLCMKHMERYLDASDTEYNQKCNFTELREKDSQNTLQLLDINDICYSPRCHEEDYAPVQCLREWCWCSDTNGIRIEGTLKKGLKEEDCTGRKSCLVDGTEYSDGLFLPASGCGLCECLDGVVTCFEDYVPSSAGELNDTQLEKLKDELMQLFFFQFNHKEHVLIDIRHIHQHPTRISESLKKTVLLWKFDYYDQNGNNGLSPGEQWLFHREIDQFVHCSTFFDHIAELMNQNGDGLIVLNEWASFFAVNLEPTMVASTSIRKRSVPITPEELTVRRLENRKRFYYTLS